MRKFSRDTFNIAEAINELMHESGVIVVENVYNLNESKKQERLLIILLTHKSKKKPTLMLKLKHLIKLNFNKGYGTYLAKERFSVN